MEWTTQDSKNYTLKINILKTILLIDNNISPKEESNNKNQSQVIASKLKPTNKI